MATEELKKFYDDLSDLAARDEGEAQAHLEKNIERLPQHLKNEVLGIIFMQEVINEANETEAVSQVQEQGAEAFRALLVLKEELKKREAEGA